MSRTPPVRLLVERRGRSLMERSSDVLNRSGDSRQARHRLRRVATLLGLFMLLLAILGLRGVCSLGLTHLFNPG